MTCPSIRFLSFVREYFTEEFPCDNIVDVLDDRGILQNGMVVDVTENGLLVDFFCKGQLPCLVEYGQVRPCAHEDVNDNNSGTGKVQVLLRLREDRPFVWYGAECLDTDPRRELVRIRLELDGAVVEEIVHVSQIRIRNVPMDADKPIDKDYFQTGSGPVPKDAAASFTESSPLWTMCYRNLQRFDAAHAMRIRNGRVEYLRRQRTTPPPELEQRTQSELPDVEKCLEMTAERMERCLEEGLVWAGRFFTRSPVTVLPDDEAGSLPFRCLLIHILVETFQYLESVDRVRLRRVSTQWDGLLSTDALFKDVWICPNYRYDCPFKWSVWDTLHCIVVALGKLVSKSTKWVMIVGSRDSREPISLDQFIEKPLGLVADVVRYLGLPCVGKLNLVLSGFRWCPGDEISMQHGVEKMANLCASCAPVCETLLLIDCTFWDRAIEYAILPIQGSFNVSSPNLDGDLWEMLDDNAPEVNLEKLSQWLTRGINPEQVEWLLEEFQAADPRIPTQSALYRRDELEHVDKGQLDLGRLTRLMLWVLSAEMWENSRGIKRPLDENEDSDAAE